MINWAITAVFFVFVFGVGDTPGQQCVDVVVYALGMFTVGALDLWAQNDPHVARSSH
jgi:hypothetical protein